MVGQRQVLGVHDSHVSLAVTRTSEPPPNLEHLRAHVDTDHPHVGWVVGDAQPGPEAHVQHQSAHGLPHLPPPAARHPIREPRRHRTVVGVGVVVVNALYLAQALAHPKSSIQS